jgi:cytosine/adenosine deaminase-related metal-dependent hydrolase
VKVATASDNIQDPFIPTGSGNILEIARWTPLAGHLHAGELPVTFGMVTDAAAELLGSGADYGLRPGAVRIWWLRTAKTPCARGWRRGQNDRCFEGKANLGEDAGLGGF